MITKKIHFISGLIVTIFVSFHLFNHVCSIWDPEKHIEIMNAFRFVYRNIYIEVILLFSVIVQIFSGLKLFKTNSYKSVTTIDKLQNWTGLYLAFFFVIHLCAVLVGRLFLKLDTNFYFGVAGLNTFPINLLFIPYYVLAILSFFGHIACIHNKKMKHYLWGMSPKLQSKAILLFSSFISIVILYGLTNHFSGVKIPSGYNVLIGK